MPNEKPKFDPLRAALEHPIVEQDGTLFVPISERMVRGIAQTLEAMKRDPSVVINIFGVDEDGRPRAVVLYANILSVARVLASHRAVDDPMARARQAGDSINIVEAHHDGTVREYGVDHPLHPDFHRRRGDG